MQWLCIIAPRTGLNPPSSVRPDGTQRRETWRKQEAVLQHQISRLQSLTEGVHSWDSARDQGLVRKLHNAVFTVQQSVRLIIAFKILNSGKRFAQIEAAAVFLTVFREHRLELVKELGESEQETYDRAFAALQRSKIVVMLNLQDQIKVKLVKRK